jgi:hypothetical protein
VEDPRRYDSRQCGRGRYLWRTPHGRYYIVDHRGTHKLNPAQGNMQFHAPPGLELYFTDPVPGILLLA